MLYIADSLPLLKLKQLVNIALSNMHTTALMMSDLSIVTCDYAFFYDHVSVNYRYNTEMSNCALELGSLVGRWLNNKG